MTTATETQPKKITAGVLGIGNENDALAGGVESIELCDFCFHKSGLVMPAMELGIKGADGRSYAGPMFSLS